ncbi:MAG: agmatine deiminase [Deltaproteobacteria bacterium]|nr:agmatine deiminase [Deltaproteobacteria bacterium]
MPRTLKHTPREDGFRMPGEFEPHQGCWMLWPERGDTWRLGARPAQKAFAEVAAAIAGFEPVTVGVSHAQYENARFMLPDDVRLVELSSDDAWMRDVGPTFVVDQAGGLHGVDWRFNAWGGLKGGLYFPWDRDDHVAAKVLEVERTDRYRAPLVLEGGSIHVDGQGTLLTTRECLLNPNRNPDLDQADIEALLSAYLNVEKIIWLEKGVYLDETDGHVDNLCCFTRPGEVLLSWCEDPGDPQHAVSREACDVLSNSRDARGRKLKIHKIHQPGPLFLTTEEAQGIDRSDTAQPRKGGDRLAGSYVNFYLANGGVVAPLFDDFHDEAAMEILARLFPRRRIVGIPTREILLGGGNIHCITQQQPGAQRPGR